MKILLIQYIETTNDKFPQPIYKLVENNAIPHAGDYIYDTLWKEPNEYKVDKVVIDYTYNRCEVTLEKCEEKWDSFERFIEMAKLHGWTDRYPIK